MENHVRAVGDVILAQGQERTLYSPLHMNDTGKCVVFKAYDDWLDGNANPNVFFVDLGTGTTELSSAGAEAPNGRETGFGNVSEWTSRQVVSSDCERVVLSGTLPLVAGVPSGEHAYLRDRSANTTTLLSSAFDAEKSPSITPDGLSVAYQVEGEEKMVTAFGVRFIQGVEIATHAIGDTPAWFNPVPNRTTYDPVYAGDVAQPTQPGDATLTHDGKHLVFNSGQLKTLGLGSANGVSQVIVADLEANSVALASVTDRGAPVGSIIERFAASGDGRLVAFRSAADNVVSGVTVGNVTQLYLRDLTQGTTTLVTKKPDGSPLTRSADYAVLSADGKWVVWVAGTAEPVGGASTRAQVYRYSVEAGTTELISRGTNGEPSDMDCQWPAVSVDGKVIAFFCDGDARTNLVQVQSTDEFAQVAGIFVWEAP